MRRFDYEGFPEDGVHNLASLDQGVISDSRSEAQAIENPQALHFHQCARDAGLDTLPLLEPARLTKNEA